MRIKTLLKGRKAIGFLLVLLFCTVGWNKAEAQTPTGAIAGLFSVSDSTQVYFSQGNLQYQASTNTWQFAEHQYDYVGNANNAISQTNSGWIDLFGWGTSGYNHGANAYQPWSTGINYSDYYAYGAYTNNLYDQTGQADWGYNAISNGGNAENSGWRTLTQPEWEYVFNTRSTNNGIRWAKGTVNGVNGVILLPDNWTASIYALNNTNGGNYGSNTITASDWTNSLEANGAVFLPAAGNRVGTSVYTAGSLGYYWSASYLDSFYARSVYFSSGNLDTNYYDGLRYLGLSVRLVRSVENTSHTYIDLGLPSGTLWATCNVGANAPEEYGDYFAWGETQTKDDYSWSTYQYCNGGMYTLTKYCTNYEFGYNYFEDNLTTLLPEDDAATANWGAGWRMPTQEEWQELLDNTTCTWTTQNGVNGRLFTASNGNSLFLPAAGCYLGSSLDYVSSNGYYWSRSLYLMSDPWVAMHLYNDHVGYNERPYGQSVRPVRSASYIINAIPNHSESGVIEGVGSFLYGETCTLTATPNEGYIFVNWTENGIQVSAEATYSFIVSGNRDLVANFAISGADTYIDLGLPSGTLWATCNVGANAPEEYGDYFAWGETQPKDNYNWNTYQHCNGSYNTLTKYCTNADWGYNGFTDNLTTLLPEDDAATANWGSDWRMPTKEEWQELYNNTTVTWTTQNGVNGRLFTSSNGNSLFLPAAGDRNDSSLGYAGSYGFFWSSSLLTGYPGHAWYLYFSSGNYGVDSDYRYYGRSVRPVRSSGQELTFGINATPNPVEGGTVSGGGAYAEGATCTLTATPAAGYTFINWTENGEVVSTEAEYSFTVTGDRNLVANFEEDDDDNLVFNGDFELGNTGFSTDYIYGNTGSYNHYYIGHDYAEMWPWDSPGFPVVDHTSGEGLYMMVDGALQDNSLVWSETVTVTPNTDYVFSAWFLTNNAGYVRFEINDVSGPDFTTPVDHWVWEQQSMTWNSGNNTEATLRIINRYAESGGYDYCIDDICFEPVNEGVVPSVFSVSDNAQVYFSRGNLQWSATGGGTDATTHAVVDGGTAAGTWRFAEHQYDYIGSDNNNVSSTYNGWIDVFGYGTSGWNSGATYYQPYDTQWSASGYASGNLNGDMAYADWGVYNAISNGGDDPSQWRTLSQAEFRYILNTRQASTVNGTANARYAKASINGINGLILLPDNYTHPSESPTLNNINVSNAAFGDNQFTIEQWNMMELAGAVFMPAAGWRSQSGYDSGNVFGRYRTTTEYDDMRSYTMQFHNDYVSAEEGWSNNAWGDKRDGHSVRLVKDVQLTSYTINTTTVPAEGGTVSGAGTYIEGSTCTLTTTANTGYTFINWTENDEEVSTEAEYSFTVTSDRTLVANFEEELNLPIPTEGLIAYYPFNGNANDESGNENHGSLQGNVPQLTTDRFGNENSAYLFGGVYNKGWIKVTNSNSLALDDALTLSYWVNFTDFAGMNGWGSYTSNNNCHAVISKAGDNGSYPGFNAWMGPSGDSLYIWSFNRYPDFYNVGTYQHDYELGMWLHCVVTVDDTLSRLYVNGVLRAESIGNPADFSNANGRDMTIGVANAGSWYPFNGKIDDVILYNRALTPQEVMQLYNIDNGCLPGAFSVAEGSYVNFSKGNLQYQASTDTWRFAENQWDCVGADNANISETYDGWIDLFGWGTSGYDHGANAYQPWSTSQNNNDYWAYGNSSASLSDYTGQADWGYNAISNGGDQEGLWHTLSHSEWDYLINSRPASTLNGVENARHAKAVVNGIAGLILFPDHYAHPEGIALPVNINAYSSLFTDNEYTMEQWYEMEAAGAVFLPTAGIRSGGVPSIGSLGIYWSTTPSGSSFAHRFDFTTDYVVAWGIDSKWYGYSVRLVKNVLTTTCSIEAVPNPAEGGTVTGAGTYFVSETCTLTAIPNEGYTFMNWTENGEVVATDATYSFTVTTERNLVANFALPFTITASATPAEGGTVSGAGEYDYGTECTLVATPNEDYNFVNWTKGETVVSTQSSYSFVVTEDADYVAHFVLKLVGTVTAEYDPDPNDNQSPYVRVSWSRDSNMQENFESGDFNMHAWEFPDSYPWVITDYNPYEGGFCMRSNNGGAHNTASSVQTTIFIPWEGQMSFWSRISSESSYDYGRFYIDDQQLGAWSGNGGWEQHIYDITAGQHTFKWAYTKDGSVNSNDDCFYVDNINFFGVTRDGTRAVHHYEVYRSEYPENGSWELIADNVSDTTYVDTDWSALAEGWYQYGVAAYYEGFDTVYPTYMARSNGILRAYPHTITATANPEEGGTITGAGDYVLYTECTLTATANENYTFVNWTEDGQEVTTEATYSFTVTTERDLVANFLLPLTITASANPEEGGTITGAGEYDYNSECTLTAIPDEDYYFVNWTENGTVVSRNAIYSFTVTTERDLVAHFEFKPVGLVTAVYDPDPEDNQSPYVRVNWNMDFNLREDFESGDFSQHEWETNWVISNNSYEGDYCMSSSNHGNYSSSYAQVTVNIPNDRQMSFWSRISSESSYDYGRFYIDDQQLGAWSGNGGWEQHTYDVSAGEHTFKWEYTKDVSLSHNDDCFYVDYIDFVSGARGDRAVDHYQVYRSVHPENGSWELLADNLTDTTYVDTDWSALAEGWYKYGVVANYAGIDTIYTTPMVRSNRILRAYPHTITATANPEEGGAITGAGEHIYNSECTLIATPNENYTFVNWMENGQEVSTEATYSFTVTTDRDLVANFVLPFTITVSAVPEEGGTVTGAGEYVIGTECTLTATANEGYQFMYWTENGAMVSSNTTYSFTVTADHSLVAYFAENTQTISLSAGWTWISTYIEQEDVDGLAMLEEGMNPNGVMIKSQSDGFLSYDANMWIGTLDAITNEKMYLVNVAVPSEVVMTGPIAHLADHPITLNPNWTWLGYPSPFEMDVNDALANLNASEGDMLKSQSGFSTYSTEYGWFGALNTLTPGMGFMYQSHNSQAISLTYSIGMSRSLRANVTTENNHWVPDIHAYPNNMSIMAVVELDGEELQDERYELAVFSGDECRGSARLVYVEAMRRYVAFLSVAGDEDAELCLALYDSATGEAYFNTSDCLNFETNAVLGSLHSPFVARFGGTTELDEFGSEAVILYPNPVSAGHVFQIELPAESKGARVSIINALGSLVSTTDLHAKPATLRAPDVPGVYTVRVVTGKQGTCCRKLIVK